MWPMLPPLQRFHSCKLIWDINGRTNINANKLGRRPEVNGSNNRDQYIFINDTLVVG
jgi:hypothetical protein